MRMDDSHVSERSRRIISLEVELPPRGCRSLDAHVMSRYRSSQKANMPLRIQRTVSRGGKKGKVGFANGIDQTTNLPKQHDHQHEAHEQLPATYSNILCVNTATHHAHNNHTRRTSRGSPFPPLLLFPPPSRAPHKQNSSLTQKPSSQPQAVHRAP